VIGGANPDHQTKAEGSLGSATSSLEGEMYLEFEQAIVAKFKSAMPPIYREQREQFARTLPLLALLSVVLTALLGGWLSAVFSVLQSLVAMPALTTSLLLTPFFWLELLPPLLWAASYFPLRDRRLAGWRLFVVATLLSLIGSLLSLSLLNLLFSAAILYFTLQCYDEFYR
jgi:amino acid permease